MRKIITSHRVRVIYIPSITLDNSRAKVRWFSSSYDEGDKNRNINDKKVLVPNRFDDDSDLLDEHGIPKKLSARKIEELYFVRKAQQGEEEMQQVHNDSIPMETIDDVVVMNLPPKSTTYSARMQPSMGADSEDSSLLAGKLDSEINIFGERVITPNLNEAHSNVITSDSANRSTTMSGNHSQNADMVLDQYKRTTMSFVSNVEANGIIGIGMGAGFGEIEDKRLGFLRPRKKDDITTPTAGDDDENKDIAHLSDAEKEKYLSPRTPEEKRIAKQREIRKHQEQIAVTLKRMNAFKGTTFSPSEHFLLVDLDYDRDSLLFGNTREEFEQNVRKMKKIIVEYTHWERRDNWYMWGTWVLKIFFCYSVYDTWCNWRVRSLLKESYDDFATIVTEEIETLGKRIESDFERAREEIRLRPPDFKPLKQSIERERRKIRAEKEAQQAIKEEKNKIMEESLKRLQMATAVDSNDGSFKDGGQSNTDVNKQVKQSTRKDNKVHHPMDTSGAQKDEDEVRMNKLKTDLMKYSELADSSPLRANRESDDGIASKGKGIITSTWELTKNIFTFSGFRRRHAEEQQKYINDATGSTTSSSSSSSFASEKVDNKEYVRNLTAIEKQNEDERILAGMAYSVAPTSIDAVKAVRRLILPRSDDFTFIVRKEMMDYKTEKLAKMNFPK